MRRTPLPKRGKVVKLERQIAGGFSGCGNAQINPLRYTKSRNGQLSLFLHQLVNLDLESHIRHFNLEHIRDELCPSCLQSSQLSSKCGLPDNCQSKGILPKQRNTDLAVFAVTVQVGGQLGKILDCLL